MSAPDRPVRLDANRPAARFYRGGAAIEAFRDIAPGDGRQPEDWVASATTVFGEPRTGLSRVGGWDLRDAFAADPAGWFGQRHAERWGADPNLLVKLLDAGERLPVHVHPDGAFAAEHLGLGHGKTEAWVFLTDAEVRLGWSRDVDPGELARWVAGQDVAAMLDATHRLPVAAGDAVLVPAGTPHAIGAGAFLIELQEPSDLSILLEWESFAIDGEVDGHLGLGFDVALGAVDLRGTDRAGIEALVSAAASTRGDLLPAAADFFRADRCVGGDDVEGFAVLVVTSGEGVLAGSDEAPVRAGETWAVPAAAGSLRLDGVVEAVLCRPPTP